MEKYIELDHQNEKNMKETKHKLNLTIIETDKYNELAAVIRLTLLGECLEG